MIFWNGDFMKNRLKKITALLLVMLLGVAVFPVSVSAASDFKVENGVLTEYTGSSKNVVIPANVYKIADSVFYGNKNIQSVDLNKTSVVGNDAFRNCTSLSTVSGYDNVSSCGAYAFYGTPFYTNYTASDLVMGSVLVASKAKGSYIVPANVKSVAPYALSGNTDITSVTIGDGVASIGEGAFYKCSALKTASVSAQVSYIGPFAFEGTQFLSSNTQEFLVLGNGILVRYAGSAASVTIPATVKQIAAGAFYENKKITSVLISADVSSIGMRAFSGCTALKTIKLSENLIVIDKEAFANCSEVTELTIPASVSVVGESAFLGCSKLATVKYMTNAGISRGMFANCSKLKSFMISAAPSSIGDLAFYNCTTLEEISVPASVTAIGKDVFKNANKVSAWCDSSSYAYKELSSRGVKVSQIGDANLDGVVNIKDATHIQKSTAGLVTMNFSASLRADVDFNAALNVRDATWIQKKVAGIV